MSEPIKKKLGQMAAAPTPQNTPASVAGSYMSKSQQPDIPNTISEEREELKKKLLSNPALLSMIEGKLGDLVGQDSGYVHSLPKSVKNRVCGLKSIQKKQFDLEAEFQQELLELERKFHGKYKPLFERRSLIVTGAVQPTLLEIEEGEQLLEEEEEEEEDEDKIDEEDEEEEEDAKAESAKDKNTKDKKASDEDEEDDIEGIPSFWLTALSNLTIVQDTITERDTEVLEHLIDIRLEYLDVPGFRLIFEFSENEFFTNKTLTKTYYYQKELGYTGDFIYDHAEGCTVNWVSNDVNATLIVERRKQRNKHTNQVRTIEKLSPLESFFNFFDPPKAPKATGEDDESPDVEGTAQDEDSEEELDEELEQRLELDYQIGELLKDKLIPRLIDWFTGEALQYEFGEEDLDEEDEDYEDDEDEFDEDDDIDEDDSDEDDEGANTKTQPPECKQS